MNKTTLVLAASLAALLSACGQKESDEAAAPPAPTTTPAPAPEPPVAPTAPAEPATPAPGTTAPGTTPPAAPAPGTMAPDTSAPGTPPDTTAQAPATTAPAAGASPTGASVYTKTCALCHATGVGGAPKPGDKADWGPRIAQGKETLYKHAIEGFTGAKGMMPPRGGGASLTDDEVKAAVDYMVEKSS